MSSTRGPSKSIPPSTPSQSIRKRARRACEPCRKRKRRCDGREPQCSSCVEWEYDCYYMTDTASGAEAREQSRVNKRSERSPDVARSTLLPSTTLLIGDTSTAFPQNVASRISDQSLLPYHNYGCNVGLLSLEPERVITSRPMKTVFTLEEVRRRCQVFLKDCNPLFPVVEADDFMSDLSNWWIDDSQNLSAAFEVAASFVMLIGAYLMGPQRSDQDQAVFLHSQSLLDQMSFSQMNGSLDIWLLRSWILRTLLLRFSGTLGACWLSSCTSLHVAESIGCFKFPDSMPNQQIDSADLTKYKALLHLIWVINQFASLESGRTPVSVPLEYLDANTMAESPCAASLADMISLLLPSGTETPRAAVKSSITRLCRYRGDERVKDPRLTMLKAMLICGLYRQAFQNGTGIEHDSVLGIQNVFQSAVKAANALLTIGQPWFMLASLSSQMLCVCLTLGRPLITQVLPDTSALLAKLCDKFPTDTLEETGNVARQLMEVCLKSREEDTQAVEKSLQLLSFRGGSSASVAQEEEEEWTRFLNQQALD